MKDSGDGERILAPGIVGYELWAGRNYLLLKDRAMFL